MDIWRPRSLRRVVQLFHSMRAQQLARRIEYRNNSWYDVWYGIRMELASPIKNDTDCPEIL